MERWGRRPCRTSIFAWYKPSRNAGSRASAGFVETATEPRWEELPTITPEAKLRLKTITMEKTRFFIFSSAQRPHNERKERIGSKQATQVPTSRELGELRHSRS